MNTLWFILGGIVLFGILRFMYLLYKECEYKYIDPRQGTIIRYYDREDDPDFEEHSPENLDIDKALKNMKLRNKLKNIENETKTKV
jgi:hypothetical protein